MLKTPSILQGIADDPNVLAALKELLERHFNEDEVSNSMTDEQIGQITRARISGIKKVGDAFKEIESHKSTTEEKGGDNPAY